MRTGGGCRHDLIGSRGTRRDRTLQDIRGLIEIERFCQVVERALVDCSNGRVERSESRDHHNRSGTDPRSQMLNGRQAVHPRQTDIHHDDVWSNRVGYAQRFFGGRRDTDFVPIIRQKFTQAPANGRLIIHNQNMTHGSSVA